MRSERIMLQERILHRAVLNVPKKPIVFVTDKGMSEWNADGSIRGAWIYV